MLKIRKRVFIGYSHTDDRLRQRLETALAPLSEDQAELTIWSDRQISIGSAWEQEIERALSNSSVAILLITSNFLASDFIRKREVPALLQRRQTSGLLLFPILAKACAWQAVSWLKQIQLVPRDNKPVWRSGGRYVDEELTAIALEVLAAVDRPDKLPEARLIIDEARAEAQTIYERILKDADAQKAERERISKALQEKIFKLAQDLRPTKRADRAFTAMDAYIRGE